MPRDTSFFHPVLSDPPVFTPPAPAPRRTLHERLFGPAPAALPPLPAHLREDLGVAPDGPPPLPSACELLKWP